MPNMIRQLFSIDVRTLALFRIGLGLLLLIDIIGRSFDLVAFYTDKGVLPRAAYLSEFANSQAWSLHLLSGSAWWQVAFFLIAGLFACSLIVGYRTRTVTIVSWVLLTSLQYRNPMILQGGDALLRMLTFWAMFLPLGAAYSVDAAMQKEAHKERSILSWGTAAILVQVGVLYWFTTVLKTGYQWIPDGTAVYYALMIDQFVTPFGLWLKQFPTLIQLLTYLVFAIEFLAIALLFPPFFTARIRSIGVVVLVAMHVGMGATLSLGLFPFVDMVAILLFVPSRWWEYASARCSSPRMAAARLYYDGTCGFCTKAVRVLVCFLGMPKEIARAAQDEPYIYSLMKRHNSWVFVSPTGEIFYEESAFIGLCSYSPLFSWLVPILSIPFVRKQVKFLYGIVRSRRPVLSRITSRFLPYRNVRLSLGTFWSVVVLCCISLVLIWNSAFLVGRGDDIPTSVKTIIYTLHLDQRWNMFAPYPRTDDGWYIIEGSLRDGTPVDVYHKKEGTVDWNKPTLVSREYRNRYWRKYMMSMSVQKYKKRRLYYGKYVCRGWNADVERAKQLKTFTIYFMQETTLDNYETKEVVKRQLWQHHCFKNLQTN